MNWVKAIGIVIFQASIFAVFMAFMCGIAYVLAYHPLFFVGTFGAIVVVWCVWNVKRRLDEDSANRAAGKKEWAAHLAEQKAENAIFDERLKEARAKLKELENEYSSKDQ